MSVSDSHDDVLEGHKYKSESEDDHEMSIFF